MRIGERLARTSTPASTSGLEAGPTSAGSQTTTTAIPGQLNQPQRSDKSIAIGLGIGVPVGLITVSVLLAIVWELRRYNNNPWKRIEALRKSRSLPQSPSDSSTQIPLPMTFDLWADMKICGVPKR